MNNAKLKNGWFDVSAEELKTLFAFQPNPAGRVKAVLWIVTLLFTPITLSGSLLGYARGYKRFMFPKREFPEFYPLSPIMRIAMISGAVLIWVAVLLSIWLFFRLVPDEWLVGGFIFYYFGINLFIGLIVYAVFARWRRRIDEHLIEGGKFGTARFAREDELEQYTHDKGFYIGGGYSFNDKGHILTVAGTRGGKGTNLIIPNLLGVGNYQGSWVVIDPKGENAAITARYQREQGQNVVILNPWGLLSEQLGQADRYNPLDILDDKSNINLVDDAQMIAEMIVPIDKNDRDKFFTDNARAIVSGMLVHMATSINKEERTLQKLWEWVRLDEKEWESLLEDMAANDDPVNGNIVRQSANEIVKLMASGERTWGTIIAVVLQCTDFIKSPALQESLKSGYDPQELSNGKTTLYVIIPADKLQSHARWLRLVVTTTMRAVVRKPGKRVCFLLDEFSALGYLPEIETALSTYAGFEITVWTILQSLIQLQNNYSKGWETFVGNSTIRQFFSVNDNFTAEYVSKAIGETSNVTVKQHLNGEEKIESNSRKLVTPDELRRASGQNIFAFMSENPVTYYPKLPYYNMVKLYNNGKPKFDENPYFR